MLFLICGLLHHNIESEPEKSIYDLVVLSQEWKGQTQPDFFCHISEASGKVAPFPRWLPGPNGTRLEFTLDLKKPTTVTAMIDRATVPAIPTMELDGVRVSGFDVNLKSFLSGYETTKDGDSGYVNRALWASVPAGVHKVTIFNSGAGWIEIPEIRIANLGSKTFHMEYRADRTMQIVERITLRAPNQDAKWWGVGLGSYRSDHMQSVSNLNVSATHGQYKVNYLTDLAGQPYTGISIEGGGVRRQSVEVLVESTVTLNTAELVPGPATVLPSLSARERSLYTQFLPRDYYYRPDGLQALRVWMARHQLGRRVGETDLALAQRILNGIQKSVRYKWDRAATQTLGACLSRGWGACGDLNGVAIGALRLSGIPARSRPGRNVVGDHRELSVAKDETFHVTSEFFAEGVGWVPLEASAVIGQANVDQKVVSPFLGRAEATHLNKHYDAIYLQDKVTVFQLVDVINGEFHGTWEGFTAESTYGYRLVSKPTKPVIGGGGQALSGIR